ncbi:MAG: GldM family protein [Saprospiraceae bacterium]
MNSFLKKAAFSGLLMVLFVAGLRAASVQDTLPPADPFVNTSIISEHGEDPGFAKENDLFIEKDNLVRTTLEGDFDPEKVYAVFEGKGNLRDNGDGTYGISDLEEEGFVFFKLFEKKESGEDRFLGSKLMVVRHLPSAIAAEKKGAEPSSPMSGLDSKGGADSKIDEDGILKGKEKESLDISKGRVFYIGIENKIRFSAREVPEDECYFRFTGSGTIEKVEGSNGDAIVHVDKPGKVEIELIRNFDGKELLLVRRDYESKELPVPEVSFAGQTDKLTKEDFEDGKGIRFIFRYITDDVPTEILSYTVTMIPKEGEQQRWTLNTADLPKDVQKTLQKEAKPGTIIFVDDVKMTCGTNKQAKKIKGLILNVVESEK